MRCQGYLEIDYRAMTAEEFEQFNIYLSQYILSFYRVASGEREYYHCIIGDYENIGGLLTTFSDRNPILNGVWDEFGNTISGTHTFNLDLHLTHQDITTSGCFCPLHGFSGWTFCCPC